MQGRKGQDSFRVTKTSASGATTAAASKAKKPAASEQQQHVGGTTTWIDFNTLSSEESRKDVRAQAARASAAARRATLAKKQARKGPQPGSLIFALPTTTTPTKPAVVAHAVRKLQDKKALSNLSAADQSYFHKLVDIVTQTLQRRPLSIDSSGETSLAHSSIRSMLWDAMTSSTTLFQVAVFMAGTHSNTCGLPRSAFAHMGPGLIALRGASIDAIQARITGADAESIAPVAIALLAGWERRYGDPVSYEVHMKAWKTLAISGKSLEEQNVATLTDLTLEMYRLGLDEQSTTAPSGHTMPAGVMASLPQGFHVFPMKRAETRSLLALSAQLAQHDPTPKSEVTRLRRIALENMAWSPTHTHSYEPRPDLEDQYDSLELNALYHIRAVHISVCGVILQSTMDMHNVTWSFDLKGGLYIHTQSCQHLRTDALIGTIYQDIGLWSRFVLCSLARDPVQDVFLTSLLKRLDVRTFAQLRVILERFVYFDAVLSDGCRALWDVLGMAPEWEAYTDLLRSYPTPMREVT
ncbi:hypothetical protein B0A55_03844 [Friedmanniomyces simplex]|uniref:Uncharacterized protein n=1 Tax=Friedmanniomyces simplex TaxID=329884 RepID=A0A4U0XNQ9_9PEZI|nr:hypothetical protein B0A55_03844 [Friedmanniomyces simplex]